MAILITAVNWFTNFINVLIIIRVFLSWVPNVPRDGILGVVYTMTDPILNPVRAMIQQSPLGGRGMVIDFSPIIALFFISLANKIIIGLISFAFGGFLNG